MGFSSLNAFDIAVITIVGLSTLLAFFNGFIKTILSFMIWIGAGFLALYLSPYIEPLLANYISGSLLITIVGNLVSYIGAVILLALLSIPVTSAAKPISKGAVDRTLGFGFGLVRGGFVVCLLFLSIVFTHALIASPSEKDKENSDFGSFLKNSDIAQSADKPAEKSGPTWIRDAETYNLLQLGSRILLSAIPEESFNSLQKSVDNIRGTTENAVESTTKEAIEGVKNSKILETEVIDPNQEFTINGNTVESLKKQWNKTPISGNDTPVTEGLESGYKNDQRKQIDRLIDQVQP